MAVTNQEFAAKTLTSISCVINETEFAEAVASARFTVAQQVNTWKGGSPDAVFTSMTKPVYSCVMKVGQDYEDAASLTSYLAAHAGEEVEASFRYNSGRVVQATLILAAPEIGGDIDAVMDTTITHGVVGVPVVLPAA